MYAKTEQAFKYFSSDFCSGSTVKRIERQNPEWFCFVEKHVMYSLDESENRDFWRYWKGTFSVSETTQNRTHLFSLSLYQWVILYRLIHSINLLCQQNASAGLWSWRDRLGRESRCFMNVWPFRSPLELTRGGFLWSFLRFAIEAASLNSSMGKYLSIL